jgi:hypothetical protein
MKPSHDNELVTANQIATAIQRSPRGVLDTIARLKIEPEASSGKIKFYTRSVIAVVESAMRGRNKPTANVTGA